MSESEAKGQLCLKKAFKAINIEYVKKIDDMPENEIWFSEKYQKCIRRILYNQKHPFLKLVNSFGKKVAVFFIAILLITGLSMSISGVREPVVEFITNIYEKFTEIFFTDKDITNAPNEIETFYTLGYIPEEYELTKTYSTPYYSETIWETGDSQIVFSQFTLDSEIEIDNEDTYTKTLLINNNKVIYRIKNNKANLFWNDNQYAYTLSLPDAFSETQITYIIESIIKNNGGSYEKKY